VSFSYYTLEQNGETGDVIYVRGSRRYLLRVEDWGEGVLRILIQENKGEHRPPFLEGRGREIPPRIEGEQILFASGDCKLLFHRRGGWRWYLRGRLLLQEADEFYMSFGGPRPVVPPLQLSREHSDVSFQLEADEPVYGGGETFGYLDKRGMRLDLRIADPCCLTTTDYSYKNIPLFWSPRGWGIFACTNYPVIADIGATSFTSFHMKVLEPCLDLFLLPGGPGEIVDHYWRLTGKPPLPPEWGLGIWWSRCMYQNAAEVTEVIDGLEKNGIKGSVISLDPMWLKHKKEWKWDACDYVWNEAAFGPMEEFTAFLADRGFKLCLWENPYVWLEGESFENLKPFLMKGSGGEPIRAEPPLCGRGFVNEMEFQGIWDLFSPESWEKRKQLLSGLVRRGAATFKADYGEGVPGADIHNLYAFLYLKNTWEAVRDVNGEGEAMIWGRPGWSGCQRFPGCWAGDSQSTFPAMASTLAGCLSLAASGVPWWSHDIGGFHHYREMPPTPELYLRWAEWGVLSPLARFHGTTPREPWHFGNRAVEAVRDLSRIRCELIPFLQDSFRSLTPRGLPVARPLVMDHPGDRNTWRLSTEYILGENLLVAPVLEEGAKGRDVYLPDGKWQRQGDPESKMLSGGDWVECESEPGDPILFEKK